jgi:hypothetical protein
MTPVPSQSGHTLVLTDAEREELLHLVEHSLGEVRVERRRTDVLAYQKEVRREESVLRSVLEKLRRPTQ